MSAHDRSVSAQNGYQAQDVGFVRIDRDPMTGATLDQATNGLIADFEAPAASEWSIFGYPVPSNDVILLRTCVSTSTKTVDVTTIAGSGAGPGQDWEVQCNGFTGGASGGPWIDDTSNELKAVNSKYGPPLAGAMLGSGAESAYQALPTG